MVTIFVLELINNKYFVGNSEDKDFTLNSYFNENDNEWTRKYKPICVKELIKNCDIIDKNKYVFEYMAKYGVINVRGGDYSQINLNKIQRSKINEMLIDNQNNCYICGNKNHTSQNCSKFCDWELCNDINDDHNYNTSNYQNNILIKKNINFINTEYEIINIKKSNCVNKNTNTINDDEIICYRCGRKGHSVDICYATTHFSGETLDRCYKCGSDNHCKIDCKQNTDIYGRTINKISYLNSFISIAKNKCDTIKKYIHKYI